MNLSPLTSKILYAILLSPLHLEQSKSIATEFALFKTNSTYRRTSSLIRGIEILIPGFAERLSRSVYRNNRFPWSQVPIELIAFGSGTAVFRLEWENSPKVLRIYRKSLGKPLSGLLEIARHYKKNYEILLSWYGNSPGLVLPMDFLILNGLTFSKPVAASLQPYVTGQIMDPFEDFNETQLLSFLEKNDFVREQFLFFAKQTIHQWNEQKMCFDFVGRENLMLVNEEGVYRLCIIDVGIFRFDVVVRKYPEKMIEIEQRMNKLIYLYENAK